MLSLFSLNNSRQYTTDVTSFHDPPDSLIPAHVELSVGQRFSSWNDAKACIIRHSVQQYADHRIEQSRPDARIIACRFKAEQACLYRIYHAPHRVDGYLEVRQLSLVRTCSVTDPVARSGSAYLERLSAGDPGAHTNVSYAGNVIRQLFIAPSTCRKAFSHVRGLFAVDGTFSKAVSDYIVLFATAYDA